MNENTYFILFLLFCLLFRRFLIGRSGEGDVIITNWLLLYTVIIL